MKMKAYGVKCFKCLNQIVVGTYPADTVTDAELPRSPIRCDQCGQASVYTQDCLIHFPLQDETEQ
ncbi:MAG TPA: hypothetical protein VK466_03150 [Terriglobales bacterium]|nr:hypothetical protein [Terriglobales bacterium]